MKYFKEIYDQVTKTNIVEGYSIQEVEDAERDFGQNFPIAYKEFLLLMGRSASFLRGIDYSMYELQDYRGDAESYLYANFRDSGLRFLRKDDLVFLSSQGCSHFFMSTTQGENPSVKSINEGQMKLESHKTYESFTNFIIQTAKINNDGK